MNKIKEIEGAFRDWKDHTERLESVVKRIVKAAPKKFIGDYCSMTKLLDLRVRVRRNWWPEGQYMRVNGKGVLCFYEDGRLKNRVTFACLTCLAWTGASDWERHTP